MPNAVQSTPTAKPVDDKPYEMPRPDRGQRVIFHPNCIRNPATDLVGYVDEVSPMNITVIVNGRLLESVPHVSDPRVTSNPHLRENGMWDFSAHDKAMEARVAKLESQVARLVK